MSAQLTPRFEAHVFPARVRDRDLRGAAAWVCGRRAVMTAAAGLPRHWPSLLDAAYLGIEQPVAPTKPLQSTDPSFELGARAKAAELAVRGAQQKFLDHLTLDIHLLIATVGPRSLQFVIAGAAYVARLRDGRAEVLSQFENEGLCEGRSGYDEVGLTSGDVVVLASASCFGQQPQQTLRELSHAHGAGRVRELFARSSLSVDRAGAAVVISF